MAKATEPVHALVAAFAAALCCSAVPASHETLRCITPLATEVIFATALERFVKIPIGPSVVPAFVEDYNRTPPFDERIEADRAEAYSVPQSLLVYVAMYHGGCRVGVLGMNVVQFWRLMEGPGEGI